ncbi:Uncharacterized protein Adt_30412 [Abeliophyllum distichum]|uniref:Uncharacterized protein n=1 Tax=Abeliophyllum distichum TaxID=126358 RepID=A0ABD1RC32_9LAMI
MSGSILLWFATQEVFLHCNHRKKHKKIHAVRHYVCKRNPVSFSLSLNHLLPSINQNPSSHSIVSSFFSTSIHYPKIITHHLLNDAASILSCSARRLKKKKNQKSQRTHSNFTRKIYVRQETRHHWTIHLIHEHLKSVAIWLSLLASGTKCVWEEIQNNVYGNNNAGECFCFWYFLGSWKLDTLLEILLEKEKTR